MKFRVCHFSIHENPTPKFSVYDAKSVDVSDSGVITVIDKNNDAMAMYAPGHWLEVTVEETDDTEETDED